MGGRGGGRGFLCTPLQTSAPPLSQDAIVQGLLDKSLPKQLAHISSLKHVLDARLTRRSAADRAAAAAGAAAGALFECPVSGAPMTGKARFLLLRPSGLVVAEKAVASAKAAVEDAAGGPVDAAAAVRLFPTPDELAAAREALLMRRAAAKKGRKRKGEREGGGGAAAKKAAPASSRARDTLALAPAGADKALYASLFVSGAEGKGVAETFACRGTGARR